MKANLLTSLSALSLIAFAGTMANAGEADATLAWQEAGYVMEVVYATAARPATAAPTETATLANQESDYVGEVVVVTANRSEVMQAAAANWLNRPLPIRRGPFAGFPRR